MVTPKSSACALTRLSSSAQLFQASSFAHVAAVAGEADDVRDLVLGGGRQQTAEIGLDLGVVVLDVEPVLDGADAAAHRADEAVLLEHGPLVDA